MIKHLQSVGVLFFALLVIGIILNGIYSNIVSAIKLLVWLGPVFGSCLVLFSFVLLFFVGREVQARNAQK